jgi:hypothetical protein
MWRTRSHQPSRRSLPCLRTASVGTAGSSASAFWVRTGSCRPSARTPGCGTDRLECGQRHRGGDSALSSSASGQAVSAVPNATSPHLRDPLRDAFRIGQGVATLLPESIMRVRAAALSLPMVAITATAHVDGHHPAPPVSPPVHIGINTAVRDEGPPPGDQDQDRDTPS